MAFILIILIIKIPTVWSGVYLGFPLLFICLSVWLSPFQSLPLALLWHSQFVTVSSVLCASALLSNWKAKGKLWDAA